MVFPVNRSFNVSAGPAERDRTIHFFQLIDDVYTIPIVNTCRGHTVLTWNVNVGLQYPLTSGCSRALRTI